MSQWWRGLRANRGISFRNLDSGRERASAAGMPGDRQFAFGIPTDWPLIAGVSLTPIPGGTRVAPKGSARPEATEHRCSEKPGGFVENKRLNWQKTEHQCSESRFHGLAPARFSPDMYVRKVGDVLLKISQLLVAGRTYMSGKPLPLS